MVNIAAQPRLSAQPRLGQTAALADRGVYVAVALVYVILLPPQFNVAFLGATFPPYRFFIIAATFYVFYSGLIGRWKVVVPDYLILGSVGWIWLSFYMNVGFDNFLIPAGGQTIDIGLSYFVARASIQTLRDFRRFLVLIAPGLAFIGAVIVLESVLHKNLLQPLVADLLGKGGNRWPTHERMGLMRARGSLPHAIHAGIIFASFLPLYWLSGLRSWPRLLGLFACFTSFFTVSSAALLALTLGSVLVAYNWLTQRIGNLTWRLFFLVTAMLLVAAEFGTKSGSFVLIMRFGSLNSFSAFNRLLIWRYGSENVKANPWFGIGYEDWERPEWMVASIDHYWLLQAIQVGIIPPTLVALATILAIVALLKRMNSLNHVDQHTARGLAMAMSVFALGVVSVSIWLGAQVWFHMMIGICVSIAYGVRGNLSVRAPGMVRAPAAQVQGRWRSGQRPVPPTGLSPHA